MSEIDYVDVQITVPRNLHIRLQDLGDQCGLTAEQMASAIFALAGTQNPVPKVESEETHL
jgi:hypothetical protein